MGASDKLKRFWNRVPKWLKAFGISTIWLRISEYIQCQLLIVLSGVCEQESPLSCPAYDPNSDTCLSSYLVILKN